jgi:lanosterol synthase
VHKGLRSYDVAVIGAGPVGCVTALSYARKGADVLLLEANPKAAGRLAGEWLHPPAVKIMESLGVDLAPAEPYTTGRGFVVFPDDGSKPIVLPYEAGSFGHSLHHERLVETLRDRVRETPGIELSVPAKATRIVGQNLTYQLRGGAPVTVFADQIVGASGRASVAHAALGVSHNAGTYSRMAGLLLRDVELPFEGFGHVCLGALGPILVYRVSNTEVRVCMDVPLSLRTSREREAVLYDGYASAIPEPMRPSFRRALARGEITWATNQTRSRVQFGRPGLALVGDAVGHHHPLTALGMTLGFQDAVTLAKSSSFAAYRRDRALESRVPEMLAIALYEVFADTHDEVVAIRSAIYDLWRSSPAERMRTMRYLACEERSPLLFGNSFSSALAVAAKRLVGQGLSSGQWGHVGQIVGELGSRIRWLMTGALHLTEARPSKDLPRPSDEKRSADEKYAGALRASTAKADVVELPSVAGHAHRTGQDRFDTARALERGVQALVALQDEDGSFEGECIWCPMLAAQMVLTWHLLGRPMDETRKRRVLLHFERTRLPEGTWGLSEVTEPNLFVTTLVYVAARALGVAADDAMLAPARDFIDREGGVVGIPSWGKFWLAMLGLYRWEGVNPVLPELWGMPRALPIHPSRYYCHTRLIYLSMATLYGARFTAPETELTHELRAELFPGGFASIDWNQARKTLRAEDLYEPPGNVLKAAYEVCRVLDRVQTRRGRERALGRLRDAIRWELQTSNHTSISPVSGLLNILALWSADPADADVERALETFPGWLWEDDRDGTRVTGARSATWDTGFALQTLSAVAPHVDVSRALVKADGFLETQQIRASFEGFERNFRIDPKGGYCFAGVWHGWPVSDCTAEAILGRLDAAHALGATAPSDDDVAMAAGFILRTQAADGGFGSYEPKRLGFSLEWLNPAEMFGDSMTENSYVECTASCLAALARASSERPHLLARDGLAGVAAAIERAEHHIRKMQLPDGPWEGAWGVHHIYGTMFGVRGLLAAGAPPTDPAIRKACDWMRSYQRHDGSWGERHAPHAAGYVEHQEGQIIQTAWAITTLLEAHDPDFDAIERGARFLARAQLGSGEWPRQSPAGIFFHTALLEYVLYKSYFPVWALSLFETRRKARQQILAEASAHVAAE